METFFHFFIIFFNPLSIYNILYWIKMEVTVQINHRWGYKIVQYCKQHSGLWKSRDIPNVNERLSDWCDTLRDVVYACESNKLLQFILTFWNLWYQSCYYKANYYISTLCITWNKNDQLQCQYLFVSDFSQMLKRY